jgi:hypothetical protein
MRAALLLALASCSVPNKFLIDGSNGNKTDARADAAADAALPSGAYVWIRSMSSISTFGVADGPAGLVVVGDLTVPANVGGGTLTSAGGTDIALACFADADASWVYSQRWGAAGNEFPFLDVLDSAGAPLMYGLTAGTPIDVGEGSTVVNGTSDGFVGRYLPTSPAWVLLMAGSMDSKFITSAHGAGSTVYVAGYFDGTTTFNGSNYTSQGGLDLFVANLNTFTGAVGLAAQFGGVNNEQPTGAAPGPNGGLIFAGMFDGTLALGGTAPTLTTAGENDIFIAEISSTGVPAWAVRFGEPMDDSNPHVAVDSNGDIYVTATFEGTITIGTTMLISAGMHDIFVAKLSGTDRSVLWVEQIGSTGDDDVRGIAADDNGHVVVSGWVDGPIDNDNSLGGFDAVITEYDETTGAQNWRKIISTPGDDLGWATTFGNGGDVYVTVNLGGDYDFGQPIIGPADPSSVILRIKP